MKKSFGIILKILVGIILLIFLLLFTIPVIFKEQIRTKVEQAINESVNATVKFEDYNLGFFRNFPNLSFSLTELSVTGIDKFETDTLAAFKSFDLIFNLSSLLKKSGYEVKSIVMKDAVVNAIVLNDGTANWDISADTTSTVAEVETSSSSGMKILLESVTLINGSVTYIDDESSMKAYLNDLNLNLTGDMTMSETDLQIDFTSGEFTYIMDGMKYLNKTNVDSKMDMLANLDSMKFTFRENYLTINDMRLNFTGMVAMPGDDIETDIQFSTAQTSFKTLLSLVPAIYMNDYKDLQTSGEFSLSGSAKGIYSDADSTLPDVSMAITVSNGIISYPSLPEQIRNVNIKSDIFVDGKDMDKTTVAVDKFHVELAGNPFDMTFSLKTPMSDPDFKGSLIGKIDLAALSKAVPMDSISLSGVIDMSVQMEGKMSMLEKEEYERFKASGQMNIKNMLVSMIGYPEVKINSAGFEFSPAYANMKAASLNIAGKSDFLLAGRLENYIPYMFSDKTIRGNLSLSSKLVDASEIMASMTTDTIIVADTTVVDNPGIVEDASELSVIQVPKNIDFNCSALIEQFIYDNIKADKLKGQLIVRDGILSFRETGMNILGGTITMNADYDTRDSLKPVMKADFAVQNIGVKDAFNTFNTVKKLAPAAMGIDGKINATLAYSSLLGSDMMPVVNSITGEGKVKSDEITLVKSETFDKMKDILKLDEKYNNTFKDVNISFSIADGRIIVSPFDVRTGNLKMNISGDQGIDQSLNYVVKTELPRSELGGSVNAFIDNLAAQASAFGISYKPSEILKVNLKVTGTFSKPLVAPMFGSNSPGDSAVPKEAVKEVVKQAVDKSVDDAKEKARVEAEIKGAKLVKEAEEKGRQLRDEAAKAAEQIRKEADFQAKKMIDDSADKNSFSKIAAQKGAETLKATADKKANQLVQEADNQANRLVEEAKAQKEEMIKKI